MNENLEILIEEQERQKKLIDEIAEIVEEENKELVKHLEKIKEGENDADKNKSEI